MSVHEILKIVGISLLFLSGISGVGLFCVSVWWPQKPTATLWGLFLIGLGGGLLLIIIPIRFG